MIEPIRYLINLFRINKMDHLKESEIFKEFIEIKQYEKEIESLLQSSSLSDEDMDNLYQASIEVARMSYYTYFKLTFTANNPLVLGKHIELICDILTLAEMGLFKDKDTKSRIAISVPPRHLKSTCITNSFPAWFMGKEPWRSTIVTSYGDNLVQKAGQKNREKIQELSSMLFGARIKKDVGKKAEWELIGNGRFKGATIRGGATGEGAECFVGSTLVMTNKGPVRIDKLDDNIHTLILTYEHKSGKIRYNKLEAIRRKMSNGIYEIKTETGKTINCTGNHPIYTNERGYIEARELTRGNTVKSYNDVSMVWEGICDTEIRIQKEDKARLSNELLLKGMQRGIYGNRWSEKTKEVNVPRMWQTNKKRFNTLFGRVQNKIERNLENYKRVGRNKLPYMRCAVQTEIKKNEVLFKKLSKQGSCNKNEGENKRQVWGSYRAFNRVCKYKEQYKRKGWNEVCKMWGRRKVQCNESREDHFKPMCSSYRCGLHEQQSRQLSNSLFELPQDSTLNERISSVKKINSNEWVYDIQVAEDHNFFANGILAHNCLIIDDPIKNREDANSKTMQEKVWDEYNDTYLTRVHQNGIIINIMTRWHNSDLRGKIDEAEKNLKWLKVDLSAICETDEELASDPFERKIGEALYPQMYDERYFEPFKMNPRTWWSLYKQKPQVDSGEYFNRGYFQYFEYDDVFVTLYTETGKLQYLVKDCWLFQTIDTAQKTGQENDETGIITWVITPDNDLLMLDVYHGRIDVPTQEKVITQYWNKWQCNFQAIEDKQSGIGLIQKFKNEGRPIVELKAVGDKIERSTTAQIFYANMKVYHLKGAEWLGYLENQLLEFPSAKHDDLMDCVAYGAKVVADKSGISSIL
ncbi:MAG: phage terminase large subunit [Aeromonas sp.]